MDESTLSMHYSTREAAKLSGLSSHMVNYLRRHGIVKASGHVAKSGRGVRVKYEFSDVLLLRVIAKLLAQGISPLRLKKVIDAMQERGHHVKELATNRYLATDGYNIFRTGDSIVELLETGQTAFAFVLELQVLREEVRGLILESVKKSA